MPPFGPQAEACMVLIWETFEWAKGAADQEEKQEAWARAAAWRKKLAEGSNGGAGMIHKVSRWRTAPIPAKPTVKQEQRGVTSYNMTDEHTMAEEEEALSGRGSGTVMES